MFEQCDQFSDAGVSGSGSVESDLGGEYVQGFDRLSVSDVSAPLSLHNKVVQELYGC